MCYGMNCKYECKYGESQGECRKPSKLTCPQDLFYCDSCEELIEDEDDLLEVKCKSSNEHIFVCKECSEDIENFTLVL